VRSDFSQDRDLLRGEGDFVHLADAKCWTTPVTEHSMLRIRLSDVIAWTIGIPE
jgi:hypothetical protein